MVGGKEKVEQETGKNGKWTAHNDWWCILANELTERPPSRWNGAHYEPSWIATYIVTLRRNTKCKINSNIKYKQKKKIVLNVGWTFSWPQHGTTSTQYEESYYWARVISTTSLWPMAQTRSGEGCDAEVLVSPVTYQGSRGEKALWIRASNYNL